jgi:hypothetical protein
MASGRICERSGRSAGGDRPSAEEVLCHYSALRLHIQGTGNLDRFNRWLKTFCVTRFIGQFGCARGELDAVIKRIEKEENPQAKRRFAREQALPIRLRMVDLLGHLYNAPLATLNNATELGTICNIEEPSMLRLKLLSGQDAKLAQLLGEPLPTAAQPWKEYPALPGWS